MGDLVTIVLIHSSSGFFLPAIQRVSDKGLLQDVTAEPAWGTKPQLFGNRQMAVARVEELGLKLCKHPQEYLDVNQQAIYCAVCGEFVVYAEERWRQTAPEAVFIYLNGQPTDVSMETGQPIKEETK